MTRMKQRITCMILLAGLVTMLAGCSEPFNGKTAGQVSFTISAKSSPDTKTAYSGDLVTENNKLYERIDWVAGDQIRIYSSDKSQVGVGVVNNVSDPVDHYNYTIGTVTANGRKSDATVNKPAEGEGLTWVNDPYGVLFYGTYPPLAATYDNDGKLMSFTGMTIPRDQTTTVDMSHAYMLAAPAQFVESTQLDESGNKIPKMHMDFYPAFNAFDIVLGSQIGEIAIDSIKLTTTAADGYLSGSYSYNNPQSQLNNGPIVNGIVYGSDNNNSVKVTLPSGTKIKPGESGAAGDSVRVTLLTLPPQTGTGLTNMVLNVYHDGKPQPASLKLNYSTGTAINFPAFHKARITGLAMEGNKWQLTVNGQVLPWIYEEKKTTFTENVQAKAFYVDGSLETLDDYMNDQATLALYGKATSNHYEAYDTGTNTEFKTYPEWVALGSGQEAYNTAHYTYYQLYYQLRTLDMAPTDPHFEVTFTPMAPFGGYWNLSTADAPSFGNTSQGGAEGFQIFLDDGETLTDNWSSGQIMNQEVTLIIKPSAQRDPHKEYCMLIRASFSPNKNGEPAYSADSELQDVHGDGRYSYWKFVIPATE